VTSSPRRPERTGPGLALLASRIAPDGILAVWSAAPSGPFESRLRAHFEEVTVLTVDVSRGEPDAVYLAGCPLV
jgi:hypothetical protein